MARLEISLLGSLLVCRDSQPVTDLASGKALALLAYVTVESDRAHQRSQVAGVLWPDQPEERARHNLRQALTTLRRSIGADDDEPCLLVQRETIAVNPDSRLDLDVHHIQRLLHEREQHAHADAPRCIPCTRRLEQAVELYRGEFLEGFSVPDSESFEEWTVIWRERLRERILRALDDLAASYRAQGDTSGAIQAVRRQLEIDPVREAAHRDLMALLWQSGNRAAALAQYARCVSSLEEELGVEPEDETTALYEEIREGDASPAPLETRGVATMVKVPTALTKMIGREREATDIIDLLSRADCRLLTITGPGGSGKTRLALHVATTLASGFEGIICFVHLGSVRDTEGMARAIAEELELRLRGSVTTDRQLLAWLRERSVILVLDNLEHLVDQLDLIPLLLSNVPDLTLLATSRQRLHLSEEWVYPIGGLTVPPNTEGDDFEGYDAIDLFTDRLRQVRGGLPLQHEDRPDIIRICQLVDGMPLALTLAAAWANTHTLQEIADGIRHNLDFLSASTRDQPDRHRNMRAVVMSSWSLLTSDEQAAWRRLSVFENGFTVDAAEDVAGTTLQTLAALINKSVLARLASGRYRMHGLLAQFGDEMLRQVPAEHTRVRDRHSRHYLRQMAGLEEMLVGRDQRRALEIIDADLDNIRLAWRWAITRDMLADLVVAAPSYWLVFVIHGWMRAGEAAFNDLLEGLERHAVLSKRHDLVHGMAMAYTGGFRSGLGRYDDAIELLSDGVSLLRQHVNGRIPGLALNMLAAAMSMKGQYTEAREQLEESLEEFGRMRDAWGRAFTLNDLGMIAHMRFHDEAGEQYCEQSRSIFRHVGDSRGQAFAATNLGIMAMQHEDYGRARRLHIEALSLREESDDVWGVAASCIQLGRTSALMGNRAQAQRYLHRALGVAWESSIVPVMLEALMELTALDMERDAPDRAHEMLLAIARHPAVPEQVASRIAEIDGSFDPAPSPFIDVATEDRWAIRVVNDAARHLVQMAH